ncbi:hypothetical protein ACTOWA_00150 [Herbaspirillum seropedicae]|uniref:hypothetical protein n=1 Tax=Herbaspirillum seropedicae TaxID=964 RepID=UPI002862845C|nr:hypothetical protein [Herbaspirillum seropedicae]MDR6398001.1 hypothetical protein [Herbaspirillum seropedicae]
MSNLINFIEGAQQILTPSEWEFFRARFIDGKSVFDSALAADVDTGGAADLCEGVLRKLRGVTHGLAS